MGWSAVKVGQETLDNKVEAMEEEVEETAKESGATGAELKGIEKKDATGGGAAENVEKVEEKVEKVEVAGGRNLILWQPRKVIIQRVVQR